MDDWDVDVHFCHRCAAIADRVRSQEREANEHDHHLLPAVHYTARRTSDG